MREVLKTASFLSGNDVANQVLIKNKTNPITIPVLNRYISFNMKVVAKGFKSGGGGIRGILNDNQTPAKRNALIKLIFHNIEKVCKRNIAYRNISLCSPNVAIIVAKINTNPTKIHWDMEFLGNQRNIEMQDDTDKKIKKDQ